MLDNCEHVIDAAAEVADDLLRRCPRLRVLATSREGLRIGGEAIWPVPPLAPDDARRCSWPARRRPGLGRRAQRRHRRDDRRDLRPPRRPAAGDRARRGPHACVPGPPDPRPPERPVPVADRRRPHGAAPPADPAGRGRLELRPALRRRAAGVHAPVGVRRRLRPRQAASEVCADDELCAVMRSPTSSTRSSTSRSSTRLPAPPTCASRSSRRWPTTAARSWPSGARPDRSATPWRRAAPSCAPSPQRPSSATEQRFVADRRRRGARQPPCRPRVGGRQRRRRDGVDDRRWRQLAALVGRHRGRGQALARRGLRLRRPGARRHASLGADWTGPDQLPARRQRGRRRRLRSGARRVPTPGRPGAARLHALVLRRGRGGAR